MYRGALADGAEVGVAPCTASRLLLDKPDMARHERSAGFVIYHLCPDGSHEFLLLDYGRHWDFPKGHVENGETDLMAAIRELREETGITDAKVVAGFKHEVGYFFRDRKKGLINKKVVFFLGATEATPNDIVISHEHEGYAFFPYEAAIRRTTFPTAREVLRLAEQAIGQGSTSGKGDTVKEG